MGILGVETTAQTTGYDPSKDTEQVLKIIAYRFVGHPKP